MKSSALTVALLVFVSFTAFFSEASASADQDKHLFLGFRAGTGTFSFASILQAGAELAYTFGRHLELGANFDADSVSVITSNAFGPMTVNAGAMFFYTADLRVRTALGHGFFIGPTYGTATYNNLSGTVYGVKTGYDFASSSSASLGLQFDYYANNPTLGASLEILSANLKIWI